MRAARWSWPWATSYRKKASTCSYDHLGDGRLRNRLRALALKIAPGRVEFRGNVAQSDLRFIYAAGDVLALPSLREGWPNVVLEAIACGTPVAAAAVGGVPEILGSAAPAIVVQDRYALQFGWEEIIARQCAVYERVVADNANMQRRQA